MNALHHWRDNGSHAARRPMDYRPDWCSTPTSGTGCRRH